MQIHSIANIFTIRHFAQGDDGITHFHLREDGTAYAWHQEECDNCGCACQGANPVHFLKVPTPGLLVIARLEPCDDEPEELGASEDGEALCPTCHADDAKERALPDDGIDGSVHDAEYDAKNGGAL